MLEKCNNDQRTSIIEIVSKDLTQIALNMHGTRAVQKLIEYLSTQEQVNTISGFDFVLILFIDQIGDGSFES